LSIVSTRLGTADADTRPDPGEGRATHGASASRRLGTAVLEAHRAYLASDVDAGLAAVAVAEHLLRAMDPRALSAHAEVVALVALGRGRLLLLAGEVEAARASTEVAAAAATAPGCEHLLGAALAARGAVEVSDGRLAVASELFGRAERVVREAPPGVTPGSAASAVVLAWGAWDEPDAPAQGGGDDLPSWLELWLDAAEVDLPPAGHQPASAGAAGHRRAGALRAVDAVPVTAVDQPPEHGPWPTRTTPAAVRTEGTRVDRIRAVPGHPVEPLVEPLTTKETEVLARLSDFLSTEQIAESMYVSVNTVRTHIRSILRKLGVSRRNEAVRRAWDLALLPVPARSSGWNG
jgi:DNA-binding CsgD family transcriptional regulator